MPDFEFNEEVVQFTRYTGNVATRKFHPAAGSTAVIVYVNSTANLPAIQAKLTEIEALCDEYAETPRWRNITPEPGFRAEVVMKAMASKVSPIPSEEP